jgi:hypothetical protein
LSKEFCGGGELLLFEFGGGAFERIDAAFECGEFGGEGGLKLLEGV